MQDIAVMYHYVRERKGWNGIVPLEPKKFIQQIELLSKFYEIVTPDNLNKKGEKPKCVLTFDDGTKDQYTIAFEILKKKGIPAYFTVMSGPLENGIIPIFNLVHIVLSLYSDEEIWEDLNGEYDLTGVEEKSIIYSYEKNKLRRFNKYALNFMLTEKQSRVFLEKRVIAKYGSIDKFINEFYISVEEFKSMYKAGMTIGVHCVNHRPYSGNTDSFYEEEIEPCAKFLREKLNITPRWYTPPFGGGDKFQQLILELEPILKKNGFKGAFTTRKGFNNGLSEFWLNRFDCVDLPPLSEKYLKFPILKQEDF